MKSAHHRAHHRPHRGEPRPMREGGMIPGSGVAAFSLSDVRFARIPVLIAAPHGGRSYPRAVEDDMRNPAIARLRLEDRLVDTVARALAESVGAALMVAHAPRAMLDLNRATDDMDWSMVAGGRPPGVTHSAANRRARSGLGLVPRRVAGVGELWRGPIARDEVETRIATIHGPYHRALARALADLRRGWGVALLIDLHSMPPLRGRHPGEAAPEFVIGDRFGASCEDVVSARALRFFSAHKRSVAHNRPYAGGYVLDRHGRPTLSIQALQLEICRSLYLDARLENESPRLPALVRLLAGLVRDLASEVAEGRAPGAASGSWPQAAE